MTPSADAPLGPLPLTATDEAGNAIPNNFADLVVRTPARFVVGPLLLDRPLVGGHGDEDVDELLLLMLQRLAVERPAEMPVGRVQQTHAPNPTRGY